MTWFRIDDQWLMHPKVQAAGRDGRALWVAAGSQCAARDADGVVDGRMLKTYAALAEVPVKRAVVALLDSGLWHDEETIAGCSRCAEAATKAGWKPGDYYIHDFLEYQLDGAGKTDPIKRDRDLRRRRLNRNKGLKAAVRRRDRDQCRYCGRHVIFDSQDRRSKKVGELDHIDPWGKNTADNVVVACKGCNSEKKDRTPEQWAAEGGRLLRPEPHGRENQDHGFDPGVENQDQNTALPRVTRDSGPGLVGTGSGPGLAGDGLGRVLVESNGNGAGHA